MKETRFSRTAFVLFLAFSAALYISFLLLDLTGHSRTGLYLKYSGVLLCFLYVLLRSFYGGPKLLVPALALTAAADLFLLILDRFYLAGVLLFCIVQLLYMLHLRFTGGRLALYLRLPLAAAAGLAVWLLDLYSPLNLLAALYFSQLLSSAVLAWFFPKKGRRFFALGLALFVCCDICVGLFNLGPLLPVGLYRAAAFSMWLFYLPSQVLVALSAQFLKR